LIGLKENVIIGKLIPAGTGMKRYHDVKLDCDYSALRQPEASEEISIDEDFDEAEENKDDPNKDAELADDDAISEEELADSEEENMTEEATEEDDSETEE